jgi:hypothetical protein
MITDLGETANIDDLLALEKIGFEVEQIFVTKKWKRRTKNVQRH